MSIKNFARNKSGDDVMKLFEGLAHRVGSKDWDVYAHQSQFQALISGQTTGKLITYSILKPSIFTGFQDVIIAGATFQDTMLYRLWTAEGVSLHPVSNHLRQTLRYTEHQNGDLITIYYAAEEAWSKQFRDKVVEADGIKTKFVDHIIHAVGALMGDEPFVWMGNNDLKDPFPQAGAMRLPNSPHGLNGYQGYHNVIVLSALNPPPAHFHFLEGYSISGDEVRTAHYRNAVYQAVMRCSIRSPQDETPKRVVVMDHDTALWLANLFPGAMVEPLPGMGIQPRKGQPGRKRQHASAAEKTKAYRERQRREHLIQLDLINNTSLVVGRYPFLAQEVRSQMSEFACDENTLLSGDIVTPPLSSGTAFSSVYAAIPLDHVDYMDDESFIGALRDLHGRVLAAKEEAGLFSPAHFNPDMPGAETRRGLANINHVRGIWLDNDGGDLSYEEFAGLFPHLRIVVWNTYSSTPKKPRWRAFIPTTYAMSIEVHRLVMAQIERVLNRAGYWGKKQLAKSKSIKARRAHGFDESKLTAASLFYLPCQTRDPHSFFKDFNSPQRGPLDLHQWIEHCILDLRPEPEPVMATPVAPTAPATVETVSANLRAVSEKLQAKKAMSHPGRQQAMIDTAIQEWRSTPQGLGHDGFFKLGAALQRAGLDEIEIKQKLHEEAAHGNSPGERRKEIKDILRSLRRRGTFGRSA